MASTDTTTAPETTTETAPEFDLLGALGATAAVTIGTNTVTVPPAVAAAMVNEVAYFSGQPNVTKRSLTMPTVEAADLLRSQIVSWAKATNHMVATPAEDKDGHPLNAGCLVTYRVTAHRAKKASRNGAVTVTNTADAK